MGCINIPSNNNDNRYKFGGFVRSKIMMQGRLELRQIVKSLEEGSSNNKQNLNLYNNQ